MVVTFLANAAPHPIGGAIAIFELANGLARRGHDVHIVHLEFFGQRVQSLDDVQWFRFEPSLRHSFPKVLAEQEVPQADFVVCFDDRIPRTRGLTLNLVTAFGALPGVIEPIVLAEPSPKLCISQYLMDRLTEHVASPDQLVYLPLGIDHTTYRVQTPLPERPPQVAMRFNAHPQKGMYWGLAALELVQHRVPGAQIVLYGAGDAPPLPKGMIFIPSPGKEALVRDIYNGSRVFVCSSTSEGFGMPSAEAMACGCALVTTDNGGSREFAIHGQTALVCEPSDTEVLATHVESLLRQDELRVDVARSGVEYIQRFDWDRSAQRLEEFLGSYGAEPDRYQCGDARTVVMTPELEAMLEQQEKLARRHMVGQLGVEEFALEYESITTRINAFVRHGQLSDT